MSEKPTMETPETDAVIRKCASSADTSSWVALTMLSMKLETERDEAREALEQCESVLRRVGCDITADYVRALLGKGAW